MTGVPRSQRLLSWTFDSTLFTPFWQSPSGHITLVKSAVVHNGTAAAVNATLYFRSSNPNVDVTLPTLNVPATASVAWEGWVVLNPGDYVFGWCSVAGPTIWVSGAVLVGAPQFPPAARDLPFQQPNC